LRQRAFPFRLPDNVLLEIIEKIHELNLKKPGLQEWFYSVMCLLDERAAVHFGDLVATFPSSNGNPQRLEIVSYKEGEVTNHSDFPNAFVAYAYQSCTGRKSPELMEIEAERCPVDSGLPYCPVVVPLGCQEYHFGIFAAGSYDDRAIIMRNSRLFQMLGMEMSRFLFATHMTQVVSRVLFEQNEDPMSFEHLLTFKFKYLIDRIDPEAGGNIMGDVITLVEKILIQLALEKTGHKLGQSAALLGINRNTLRKKIQVLGLETKDS